MRASLVIMRVSLSAINVIELLEGARAGGGSAQAAKSRIVQTRVRNNSFPALVWFVEGSEINENRIKCGGPPPVSEGMMLSRIPHLTDLRGEVGLDFSAHFRSDHSF